MKKLNILIILVLVTSCLIMIGIGHGVGPLFLIELISIPAIFAYENGTNSYSESLETFSFISSFIAHILLILASRNKKVKWKIILSSIGQLLLLVSIFILTRNYSFSNSHEFTLYSSTPALVSMVLLSGYIVWNRKRLLDKGSS